jgi:hypothetical protein
MKIAPANNLGRLAPASEVAGSEDMLKNALKLADHALFKMVRYILLQPLRPELDVSWSNFHGLPMISLVYGLLVAGLPNNRAAFVGCHGRHLRPIFANWLYQLPTLPLPLFTCHAKVATLPDSLFMTW